MSDVYFKPMSQNVVYASSNGGMYAILIAAVTITMLIVFVKLFLKAKTKKTKVLFGIVSIFIILAICWCAGFLWIYRDYKGP